MTDAQAFYDLFVHRCDVFAQQHANGSYTPVRQPITVDDVEEHLAGFASYGVYVIDPYGLRDGMAGSECKYPDWQQVYPVNSVKYVVFDLDVLDEEAADTLCSLVMDMKVNAYGNELYLDQAIGSRPYLREFSGNKGTHVWLFFDAPVPAEKVRRWVAADFMPQWQEVAREKGWPTALEVFPKQDSVPEGGFGNLVKLPLGVHQVSGKRSEIVRCRDWPTCVEEVVPLPASLVPDREVVSVGVRTRPRGERRSTDGPASPFPCIDHIMRDGVGQGYRDRAMFHLALYFYGHGIDQDIALELCQRANESFDPPLSDREVETKVNSAYRGTFESAKCGVDWLAEICPGPCRSGWHVQQQSTAGELSSAVPGATVEVEVLAVRKDDGRRRVTVGHEDADNTPTFVLRSTA